MGSHTEGQAIGWAAEAALANRKQGETALDILDRICKRYRGLDVEFESTNPDNHHEVHPEYGHVTDPHPSAALGMLMLEAFSPGGVADLPKYAPMLVSGEADGDEAYDRWSEAVGDPFSRRYAFG